MASLKVGIGLTYEGLLCIETKSCDFPEADLLNLLQVTMSYQLWQLTQNIRIMWLYNFEGVLFNSYTINVLLRKKDSCCFHKRGKFGGISPRF